MLLLVIDRLLQHREIVTRHGIRHRIESQGRQQLSVCAFKFAVALIQAQLRHHRARGCANLLQLALCIGLGRIMGVHQDLLIDIVQLLK